VYCRTSGGLYCSTQQQKARNPKALVTSHFEGSRNHDNLTVDCGAAMHPLAPALHYAHIAMALLLQSFLL
jgi:hypothetical protein